MLRLVGGSVIVGICVDTRERRVSSRGVGAADAPISFDLGAWQITYEKIRGIGALLGVASCWMPAYP